MTVHLVPERVFDGERVLTGHAVAIEDGRVTGVLPLAELPADARREELPGLTLAPGLIDMHAHITPWMVFGLLAAGVTRARDTGNDVPVIRTMLERLDNVPLPVVHWSGPLIEGSDVNWPSIAVRHESPDLVEATVSAGAARGDEAIKMYYNATPDIVGAATTSAHAHGLRALGHVGRTTFDECVERDVDELQHFAGCLPSDLGLDDEAGHRHIAESDIEHCPTLGLWLRMARLGEPSNWRDRELRWVHPQALRNWKAAHHASQPAQERLRRLRDFVARQSLAAAMITAGRSLLVGSDTPFPGVIPGFSLHDEAGLLVEAGMTPLAVMTALTSGNAAALGSTDAGRIVAGVPADLVAFAGDPTERIAEISEVAGVWRDGVRIDLDALLERARQEFGNPADSPVDLLADLHYVPATVAR